MNIKVYEEIYSKEKINILQKLLNVNNFIILIDSFNEISNKYSRFLIWMCSLHIFGINKNNIKDSILIHNEMYDYLKIKYLTKINIIKEPEENPLNNFINKNPDNEIIRQIKVDIIRIGLNQELINKYSDIIFNVLFIWDRENINLGYRQGMSELLGMILKMILLEIDDIKKCNDFKDLNIECLLYNFFTNFVYEKIKENYLYEARIILGELEPLINKKISNISKNLLKKHNPNIYSHFKKLKFSPYLNLLKWIRLLFLREFSFEKNLIIWDLIIIHRNIERNINTIDIIDCMCISIFNQLENVIIYINNESELIEFLQKPINDININDLLINLKKLHNIEEKYSENKNLLIDKNEEINKTLKISKSNEKICDVLKINIKNKTKKDIILENLELIILKITNENLVLKSNTIKEELYNLNILYNNIKNFD